MLEGPGTVDMAALARKAAADGADLLGVAGGRDPKGLRCSANPDLSTVCLLGTRVRNAGTDLNAVFTPGGGRPAWRGGAGLVPAARSVPRWLQAGGATPPRPEE
jgi:hypothetical protein